MLVRYSAADIDECVEGNIECGQQSSCANTDGSFECFCQDGFRGDGLLCLGIHPPSALTTTLCPFLKLICTEHAVYVATLNMQCM